MADIFISYAKEDQSRIEPLVKALEKQRWSVWWDRKIPAGKTWREVIGKALESARTVVVAWSKTSINSRYVQEEADWALDQEILIPIFIDEVMPPFGFRAIHAIDLTKWEPSHASSEYDTLLSDLMRILGSPKKKPDSRHKLAGPPHALQGILKDINPPGPIASRLRSGQILRTYKRPTDRLLTPDREKKLREILKKK